MRQLGIPNTIAFLNITTKEDALNRMSRAGSESIVHGGVCCGWREWATNRRDKFGGLTVAIATFSVWEKIKSEKGTNEFKADVDEECEDSLGNVISKKTYEMLRINGLL
jgi:hypothetical protein